MRRQKTVPHSGIERITIARLPKMLGRGERE
jgi:hypothetical protein